MPDPIDNCPNADLALLAEVQRQAQGGRIQIGETQIVQLSKGTRFCAWLAQAFRRSPRGKIGDEVREDSTLGRFKKALANVFGTNAAEIALLQVETGRVARFGLGKHSVQRMLNAARRFNGTGMASSYTRKATLHRFNKPRGGEKEGHAALKLENKATDITNISYFPEGRPAYFCRQPALFVKDARKDMLGQIGNPTRSKLEVGALAREILKMDSLISNISTNPEDFIKYFLRNEVPEIKILEHLGRSEKELRSLYKQDPSAWSVLAAKLRVIAIVEKTSDAKISDLMFDSLRAESYPDKLIKELVDCPLEKLEEYAAYRPLANQVRLQSTNPEIDLEDIEGNLLPPHWGQLPEKICLPLIGPTYEYYKTGEPAESSRRYVMFGLKEGAIKRANAQLEASNPQFRGVTTTENCASVAIRMLKAGGAEHYARQSALIFNTSGDAVKYTEAIQARVDRLNGSVFDCHKKAAEAFKTMSPEIASRLTVVSDAFLHALGHFDYSQQSPKEKRALTELGKAYQDFVNVSRTPQKKGTLDAAISAAIIVAETLALARAEIGDEKFYFPGAHEMLLRMEEKIELARNYEDLASSPASADSTNDTTALVAELEQKRKFLEDVETLREAMGKSPFSEMPQEYDISVGFLRSLWRRIEEGPEPADLTPVFSEPAISMVPTTQILFQYFERRKKLSGVLESLVKIEATALSKSEVQPALKKLIESVNELAASEIKVEIGPQKAEIPALDELNQYIGYCFRYIQNKASKYINIGSASSALINGSDLGQSMGVSHLSGPNEEPQEIQWKKNIYD